MDTHSFFQLRFSKALQATGVLLRTEANGCMNYMKLLKLLYIADREALKETGRSITGDRVVAMERGPLPSGVYDIIKGEHLNAPRWGRFIAKNRYIISQIKNPGIRHLSRFEIAKLQEVATRHTGDDEWEMVRITHELPEWKKNEPPAKSCNTIPLGDILDAVGRKADEKAIVQDAANAAAYARFFATMSA